MAYSFTITLSDDLVELAADILSKGRITFEDVPLVDKPSAGNVQQIPTDDEARRKLWRSLEEEFDTVEAESRRDLESTLEPEEITHVVRNRKVHTRNTYTTEQKRESIRLRLEENYAYAGIEKLTGVAEGTVAHWVSLLSRGKTVSLTRANGKGTHTLRRADFGVFSKASTRVRSGASPGSSSVGQRS